MMIKLNVKYYNYQVLTFNYISFITNLEMSTGLDAVPEKFA